MVLWIIARQFIAKYSFVTGKSFLLANNAFLALIASVAFLGYSRALNPGNENISAALRYTWLERVDAYDLTHYYLVPKYFKELSYFRLYPAVLTADAENGGPYYRLYKSRKYVVFQDSKDYYWANVAEFLQSPDWQGQAKQNFSAARWEQFSHDMLYLQRGVGGFSTATWNDMLWDHGFNGTPAWVATISWLTNVVPIEQVKLICYLDVLFLLLSFIAVWWAFSFEAALVYFIFIFSTYSTRWPTISWVFGRYDYVSLMVITLCLLKRQKFLAAGLCGGWAGSLRIFPFLWFFGPAVTWLSNKLQRPKLTALLFGLVISIALLWGNAFVRLGSDEIPQYFKKMAAHTSIKNLSSMREGFALALAYEGDLSSPRIDDSRRDSVAQLSISKYMISGLVLIVFFYLCKSLPPYESYAYGFIPFFMLLTASYYYYVVRAPLIILHAGQMQSARHRISLGFLFLVELIVTYLAIQYPLLRVLHIGILGWMLTAYVFLSLYLILQEQKNNTGSTNNG